MDRSATSPPLDGDAGSQEVSYRSVSTPAVVGFVLALLSPVAFISGLLVVVPLAAAFICFLAARGVERDSDTKTGLGIALAGMAISLIVATAAYTRGITTVHLHQRDAGPVAERFFELLSEGETIGALELTKRKSKRLPGSEEARLFYEADTEAISELKAFESDPVVRLLSSDDPPRLVLVSSTPPAATRGGRVATSQLYEMKGDSSGRGVRLNLERSSALLPGPMSWRIAKYEMAAKAR